MVSDLSVVISLTPPIYNITPTFQPFISTHQTRDNVYTGGGTEKIGASCNYGDTVTSREL